MNINSRKLQLLELLRSERTYQPTKFFSSLLGVSNKTIYNDLKELSELVPSYNLQITSTPRKGILLEGDDQDINRLLDHIQQRRDLIVINYSPSYRKLKILEYLLLSSRKVLLEDLEKRFSVSDATIKNDIKEITSLMKEFNCGISYTNSKYSVFGNENCIQKSFAQYFLNILSTDYSEYIDFLDLSFKQFITTIFDNDLVETTYEIMDSTIDLFNLPIANYYKVSLFVTLLIQVTRIQMGYHNSAQENIVFENFNHYESYVLASEIAIEFEKRAGLEFAEDDIKSLSERLFAHRIEPTITNNLLSIKYQSTVDSIIKKMSQLISVDFSNDDHLKNSLMYHIPSMIFRLNNNYQIKNPLLEDIKEQYLLLYSLTWFVLSELEEEYDILLSDDEVSFVLIHFQIALDKISIPKKIVIVCEHGIATSELMLSKVQQIIPSKQDVIKTLTKKELLSSDLRNVDFIISTVNLPDNLGVNVLRVNPFLKTEDINNILTQYTDLTMNESRLKKPNVLEAEDFDLYFSSDFTFINKDFKNKSDCLNFIVDQYEKHDLVTNEFKKSLFEREKMGNTSLATEVAIPHASPSSVKKTKILVMSLNKPIRWVENNHVDFVVVLGISENNLTNIMKLVSRILEIVDDMDVVNSLKQAKSPIELLNLLRHLIEGGPLC